MHRHGSQREDLSVWGLLIEGKKWGARRAIFSPPGFEEGDRLLEGLFQVLAVDGWQAGFGENAAHESSNYLSPPSDTAAPRGSRCALPGDRGDEQRRKARAGLWRPASGL